MPLGLSVVICTHNGSARLPATLRHLAAQKVPPGREWEVVVVDNASADNTSLVAREVWPSSPPTSLRLATEPQLGLAHARRRGIAEARYPLVAFVDDDNWLAPEWVETAASLMDEHPEIGALGGFADGVLEVPPPSWLPQVEGWLAIGPRHVPSGDITDSLGGLYGAGLVLRTTALAALAQLGFEPLLVDRAGATLSGGGDTELCLALRLAGWRLWLEPTLRLQHYIPASRLTWTYLRRLFRMKGIDSVYLDAYHFALRRERRDPLATLRARWWWQVLAAARTIAIHPGRLWHYLANPEAGDTGALHLEMLVARLATLLRLRRHYDRGVARVCSIPWQERRVGKVPAIVYGGA